MTKRPGGSAIRSVLEGKPDGYQMALVYDWCQEILTEPEKKKLEAALQKAMDAPGKTLEAARNRLLAAMVLESEPGVRRFIEQDWKPRIADLRAGRNAISREEIFAALRYFERLSGQSADRFARGLSASISKNCRSCI